MVKDGLSSYNFTFSASTTMYMKIANALFFKREQQIFLHRLIFGTFRVWKYLGMMLGKLILREIFQIFDKMYSLFEVFEHCADLKGGIILHCLNLKKDYTMWQRNVRTPWIKHMSYQKFEISHEAFIFLTLYPNTAGASLIIKKCDLHDIYCSRAKRDARKPMITWACNG